MGKFNPSIGPPNIFDEKTATILPPCSLLGAKYTQSAGRSPRKRVCVLSAGSDCGSVGFPKLTPVVNASIFHLNMCTNSGCRHLLSQILPDRHVHRLDNSRRRQYFIKWGLLSVPRTFGIEGAFCVCQISTFSAGSLVSEDAPHTSLIGSIAGYELEGEEVWRRD